jgi:hypothetical protein
MALDQGGSQQQPGQPSLAGAQVVLSAGWDYKALVWDLRTGRAERTINGVQVCGDALDVQGKTILTARSAAR